MQDVVDGLDGRLGQYIYDELEVINSTAVVQGAGINKFLILPKDFTVEDGELTAIVKLRRKVVESMYKKEIDKLYIRQ